MEACNAAISSLGVCFGNAEEVEDKVDYILALAPEETKWSLMREIW